MLQVPLRLLVVLALALLTPVAGGTQPVSIFEDAKLEPSDGDFNDRFGQRVAVSGDAILVGSQRADPNQQGAGYIYRWDGTDWQEEAKFQPFKWDLDLSGDVALVSRLGSAYVYRRGDTDWLLEESLASGIGDDNYGFSVSLSSGVAIVGAPYDDENGSRAGAAYVYRLDETGWAQEAKLLASDAAADDEFATSVALSEQGDVAVVGAFRDEDFGSVSGSAYVFRWDGSTWNEEAKLLASDGAADARFGQRVAVSDDVALIGAEGESEFEHHAGAAYVFRFDGSTWSEEAKLVASDGISEDHFGFRVSVAGNRAVASTNRFFEPLDPGAAYLFDWNGTAWVETGKLLASDGVTNAALGGATDLSGQRAVLGDIRANLIMNPVPPGAAYVYDLGSCGDGTLDSGEACDDGGQIPGDGCSGACEIEACANGIDDDGDGLTDFAGGDPGCWGAADLSEQSGWLPCDNGFDDDGDGLTDSIGDPACSSGAPWAPDPAAPSEHSLCQDGLNNDPGVDALIDWDGGASAGLPPGEQTAPDPECETRPWRDNEAPRAGCGLGFEFAPALALLFARRRRRRAFA